MNNRPQCVARSRRRPHARVDSLGAGKLITRKTLLNNAVSITLLYNEHTQKIIAQKNMQ